MREGATVRVLQSFKQPGPTTNPYVTQLYESLLDTPGVSPSCFTWRAALLGGYDVFHAHWPESLIEQRGAVSTWGRRVLYAILLLRFWLRGTPVVRTVHNLDLPRGISWFDRRLLLATERLTRVRIVLNEFTPVPAGSAAVLIEHGHYRTWFAKFERPEPVPGSLVFFGKLRRYKNVDGLIAAFRDVDEADPAPTLRVVGSPSTPELAASLEALASGDPRVTFSFGHVDDRDLAREVGRASAVVLPYPEMHNSGSVLAALSMARPVLVPDNDFNRSLAEEVGEEWVVRYAGDLTGSILRQALERSFTPPVSGKPDLSRREWDAAGERHLAAYWLAFSREEASRVK